MTDSKGNTWVQAYHRDQTDSSANIAQDFWYAVVTRPLVAGGLGDDAGEPGNSSDRQLAVDRDLDRAERADNSGRSGGGQTSFSKTHTSPNITTTTVGDLLFGCHSSQSISGAWWTPGAGPDRARGVEHEQRSDPQRRPAVQGPGRHGTFTSSGASPSNSYSIDSIVAFK